MNETESNDTIGQANLVPISHTNPDYNVQGNNTGNENDYFSVLLKKGDILGIAARTIYRKLERE